MEEQLNLQIKVSALDYALRYIGSEYPPADKSLLVQAAEIEAYIRDVPETKF